MLNWAPLVLAVLFVFVLDKPDEKESPLVSGLTYFALGVFPLQILAVTLYLGLPVALMLLARRVKNRPLKIAATLAGAAAGWVYFTWLRPPG